MFCQIGPSEPPTCQTCLCLQTFAPIILLFGMLLYFHMTDLSLFVFFSLNLNLREAFPDHSKKGSQLFIYIHSSHWTVFQPVSGRARNRHQLVLFPLHSFLIFLAGCRYKPLFLPVGIHPPLLVTFVFSFGEQSFFHCSCI